MDLQRQLRKYAELGSRIGLNLQPGQNLVIGYGQRQVLPEHIEFSRLLVEVGYEVGAKYVHVDWGDEAWLRQTVQHGAIEALEERAKWQVAWVEKLAEEGAAFLAIPATDPNLYAGIDPERVTASTRATSSAFRPFNDKRTNNQYSWNLLSAPTQAWADQVYPELPASERFEALWKGILACARATGDDPVRTWKDHLEQLAQRAQWLTNLRIRTLHFQSPGTDLTVAYHEGHYWTSAQQKTSAGLPFVANIPTEEVYSAPLKAGVNGTVSSTMPLNHNGNLINGIRLRFEEGRIVEYHAETGLNALRSIIEADEGSHYLGEVALVPVDSPISQMNRLFYNTLFDENASCHLAIGKAYPLIEGGHNLNMSDWESHGLNYSLMHVDFMIGSARLNIDAQTADGRTVPIMRDGKWANS